MIRDWLPDFLERLAESFPPLDWPKAGTDAWDVFEKDWTTAFARNGVNEAEAEEARSLLAETPPKYKREYIAATISAIKILRDMKALAEEPAVLTDRESAKLASRDCPYCFDDGLVSVVASRPNPEKGIPPTTAAYCVCPYGRWVMENHRTKSPHYFKRIPDFARVLAGTSFWRVQTPEMARTIDAAEGSPFTPTQLIRGMIAEALVEAEEACRVQALRARDGLGKAPYEATGLPVRNPAPPAPEPTPAPAAAPSPPADPDEVYPFEE
jgi:hypothetical protein